jgi:hypothetical protein
MILKTHVQTKKRPSINFGTACEKLKLENGPMTFVTKIRPIVGETITTNCWLHKMMISIMNQTQVYYDRNLYVAVNKYLHSLKKTKLKNNLAKSKTF